MRNRRKLIAALTLIGLGFFLGTTLFREDIAHAAQLVSAEIVGPLDEQGNVKVHEQGTADVRVMNRAVPIIGTVDLEATTSKLLGTSAGGDPVLHGTTRSIGSIDTASLSQLRVGADARDCYGAVLHADLVDAFGPSRRLLEVPLTFGDTVARVLDVPGTELSFAVSATLEFDCHVDVTVWGR
jgi:hypothetical protein